MKPLLICCTVLAVLALPLGQPCAAEPNPDQGDHGLVQATVKKKQTTNWKSYQYVKSEWDFLRADTHGEDGYTLCREMDVEYNAVLDHDPNLPWVRFTKEEKLKENYVIWMTSKEGEEGKNAAAGYRSYAVIRGRYRPPAQPAPPKPGPGGNPGGKQLPPEWFTNIIDLDIDADTNRDGSQNLDPKTDAEKAKEIAEDANEDKDGYGALVAVGERTEIRLRQVMPPTRPVGEVKLYRYAPVYVVEKGTDTHVFEPKTTIISKDLWSKVDKGEYHLEAIGTYFGKGQLDATYQGTGVYAKDTIRIATVMDLDTDSNNNGQIDFSDEEDAIEDVAGDPTKPGKIIFVNSKDADGDGIPDFADGFNWDGDPNTTADNENIRETFEPLVLVVSNVAFDVTKARFRVKYSASDPSKVTRSESAPFEYRPAPGALRIWKKPGWMPRNKGAADIQGGDFVVPGEDHLYIASQLGLEELGAGLYFSRLYVEGIDASSSVADQRVTVEIDPDGPDGPAGFVVSDSVRFSVVKASIVEVKGLYTEGGQHSADWTYKSEDHKGRIYANRKEDLTPQRGGHGVELKAKIVPEGLVLPSGYTMEWIVDDPDDPSDSTTGMSEEAQRTIDPNDFDAGGRVGNRGRDNRGTGLDLERGEGFPVSNKRERSDADRVLSAETPITAGISRVRLKASNAGGDNYIVRVGLKTASSQSSGEDHTGIMTLWRLVYVEYANMPNKAVSLAELNPRFSLPCIEFIIPDAAKHQSADQEYIVPRGASEFEGMLLARYFTNNFRNLRNPLWVFVCAGRKWSAEEGGPGGAGPSGAAGTVVSPLVFRDDSVDFSPANSLQYGVLTVYRKDDPSKVAFHFIITGNTAHTITVEARRYEDPDPTKPPRLVVRLDSDLLNIGRRDIKYTTSKPGAVVVDGISIPGMRAGLVFTEDGGNEHTAVHETSHNAGGRGDCCGYMNWTGQASCLQHYGFVPVITAQGLKFVPKGRDFCAKHILFHRVYDLW